MDCFAFFSSNNQIISVWIFKIQPNKLNHMSLISLNKGQVHVDPIHHELSGIDVHLSIFRIMGKDVYPNSFGLKGTNINLSTYGISTYVLFC